MNGAWSLSAIDTNSEVTHCSGVCRMSLKGHLQRSAMSAVA